MSSTSARRLNAIKESLDIAFHNAHPNDRVEMVKELREYLSLQRAGATRPSYDSKSTVATGSGLEGVPVK